MLRPALLAALTAAALAGPAAAADRPRLEFAPMSPRLPFSPAVRVDDVLYLSGQIGNKPDGSLPPGIDAQTRQAMDNIGTVLKGQGLGWGDVVKCTVMLDEIKDWPAFNAVYVTYFEGVKFPARSAFGADGLAMGALVELECWAHVPQK
jgi:reactive intermediate/imine deaminase